MNSFERFSMAQPDSSPEEEVRPDIASLQRIFYETGHEEDEFVKITPLEDDVYSITRPIVIEKEEGNAELKLDVVVRKSEEKADTWKVSYLSIEGEKGPINMLELLPTDAPLCLNANDVDYYNPSTREVSIKSLNGVQGVSTLLHEVGHARDFARHPSEEGEFSASSPQHFKNEVELQFIQKPEETAGLIKLAMTRERNAWAGAHQIARKYIPEMGDFLRLDSSHCLRAYDRSIASTLVRGHDFESFASSEQRASMRGEEKLKDSYYLWKVGSEVSKVKNIVGDALGLDLGLRKESFSFRFSDPDNTTDYFVGFSGSSTLVQKKSPLDVSQQKTILEVTGTEIVKVTVGSLENDQNWFEGNIYLLAQEGQSNDAGLTYGLSSQVLRHLQEPEVAQRMTAAALKKMYPDGTSGKDM